MWQSGHKSWAFTWRLLITEYIDFPMFLITQPIVCEGSQSVGQYKNELSYTRQKQIRDPLPWQILANVI